jgi:hypothetical protein
MSGRLWPGPIRNGSRISICDHPRCSARRWIAGSSAALSANAAHGAASHPNEISMMNKSRFLEFLIAVCLLTAGLFAPLAKAGTIVIGAAPGGGVDLVARHLARNLGGYYSVSNKPGLDAAPAAREMQGKATDGSELMVVVGNDESTAAGRLPPISTYAHLTPVAMLGASRSGSSWYGLFAPPGTPASVVSSLNARVRQAIATMPPVSPNAAPLVYAQDMSAAALSQRLAAASRAPAPAPAAPAPSQAPTVASSAPSASGGVRAAPAAGNWPPGVEPGNLFVVRVATVGLEGWPRYLLLSARTRADAESILSRARAVQRQGRHKSDATYQILYECPGANWGAVVRLHLDNQSPRDGFGCGARTPREAILAATKKCGEKVGPCDRVRSTSEFIGIQVGHSGAKSWWDNPATLTLETTFGFAALEAHLGDPVMGQTVSKAQSVQEAIDKLGQTCGKGGTRTRDIHSCWTTSRNNGCLGTVRDDPRDRMPNRQQCVDRKFTADGVLP